MSEETYNRLDVKKKPIYNVVLGEHDPSYGEIQIDIYSPSIGDIEGIKKLVSENPQIEEGRMDDVLSEKYMEEEMKLIINCTRLSGETTPLSRAEIRNLPLSAYLEIVNKIKDGIKTPLVSSPNGQARTLGIEKKER